MSRSYAKTFSLHAAGLTLGSIVAAIAIVAAAGGAGTSSEALLRSSFSAAIGQSQPAAERTAAALPVAGSEDFWLNAMRADAPAGLSKAVSVGDQISMTLDGVARRYTVQTVSEVAPAITTIDTASEPQRYVMVTAHDAKDPQAKPLRLVVEIPSADLPSRTAHRDRAL